MGGERKEGRQTVIALILILGHGEREDKEGKGRGEDVLKQERREAVS